MDKFNFDEIAKAINYYDYQYAFYKGDGSINDFDEYFERGIDEDDFPKTVADFKKLGYGFSKEIFECNDNDKRIVNITFDNEEDLVIIESDKFTIKECFIVVDMVIKHLRAPENLKRELFVAFGNDKDETHVLYHGESTAFGMWWESFHDLFVKRMKGKNKMKRIYLSIEDYQTSDAKYYTKDRVIHITLE